MSGGICWRIPARASRKLPTFICIVRINQVLIYNKLLAVLVIIIRLILKVGDSY